MVFHRVLIAQVMNSCVDKWIIRWMENWLNHQAQRMCTDVPKFSWHPVKNNIPQGQTLRPALYNVFINNLAILQACE